MERDSKLTEYLCILIAFVLIFNVVAQLRQYIESLELQLDIATEMLIDVSDSQTAQLEREVEYQAQIRYLQQAMATQQADSHFRPLDIDLPVDYQWHTWQLCEMYPTPLATDEFYHLVLKVMWNESRFQLDISDNHNPNGTVDRGPMQINSINWPRMREAGLNPDDPGENIECGVFMLSELLNSYPLEFAVTAYGLGITGAYEVGGVSDTAIRVINMNLEKEDLSA